MPTCRLRELVIYQQLQAVRGASAQVFAYLDLEEEKSEQPGASSLAPFTREIEFSHVDFSYEAGLTPVLDDICLKARKGEVLALVGSSGAGKTTLVNLLPRFYQASCGTILIDGADIRNVTIRSLREQIAWLPGKYVL
jgi:ABC-type multidrug transport system fused ATPase/permease subunit